MGHAERMIARVGRVATARYAPCVIRSREEWERIRAQGRARFVVMTGIVARGIPMGIVVALAIEILTGEPIPDSLWSARFGWRLLLAMAVFSASGSLSAFMNWRLYERRFAAPGSGC